MECSRRCFVVVALTLVACQTPEERAAVLVAEGRGLLASQPAEAEAAFQRALDEAPSLDAWLGLARARAARGAWAHAQEAAERAIALDDSAVEAHEVLARSAMGLERWSEARSAIERTLELDRSQPLHFELARVLEHLDATEEARAAYERAIEAEVEPAASRLALARLTLDAEELEAARRWLDAAEPDSGDHPEFQASRERLAAAEAEAAAKAAAEAEAAAKAAAEAEAAAKAAAEAEAAAKAEAEAAAKAAAEAAAEAMVHGTIGQGRATQTGLAMAEVRWDSQIGLKRGSETALVLRPATPDSDEVLALADRLGDLRTEMSGRGGVAAGAAQLGTAAGRARPSSSAGPSRPVSTVTSVEGDDAIRAAVAHDEARLDACVAVPEGPRPRGVARFRVVVGEGGVDVRTASSTLGDTRVEACVANVLRQLPVRGDERREATVKLRVGAP